MAMTPAEAVLFFADGSEELGGALTRILNLQSGASLASRFLEQSLHALQEEWCSLPSFHRQSIPAFTELRCIAQCDETGRRHTSLHSVEVVLVQLAHFIEACERRPDIVYPLADTSVLAGVCYGELAAAAVALAPSLHELIPFAVDAVRLAFRGGVLTAARGFDIEPSAGVTPSWSATVSRDTGLDTGSGLAQFHKQQSISPAKEAWISTQGKKTIVLGGPPSTLDQLSGYINGRTTTSSGTVRRLPVSTPCHAPHLYSAEDSRKLLEEPRPLASCNKLQPVSNRPPMMISGTGRELPLSASAHEVFLMVVENVLSKPILWSDTVSACHKSMSSSILSIKALRTFGPESMGRRFASDAGIKFDESHASISTVPQTSRPSIAIVGMSGRFPAADDTQEFWNVLRKGKDCCEKIPPGRLRDDVELKQTAYGCFLKNPGSFDPLYFHLSPREALETDPGQRLSIVTAEEALHAAGFVPNRTTSTQLSRIGTFWGQAADEYKEISAGQEMSPYYATGTLRSFGPGRINYFRKFDGPSMSIDTACSSSMVALHQACLAIWSGQCDTAVVGGANVLTSVDNYNAMFAGRFLSPTGACRTFDADADGYCRGEAAVSIVIKALDQAMADNDNILGVIKGIATNHSSNASSLTRPHAVTQETLFRKVLEQSGVKNSEIDYVEMHGTGTQVGDSTELTSVVDVFASGAKDRNKPLHIGAVKSNVGHGEAASGVTSLVKCLLMMKEKEIPPHIGVRSGRVPLEAELAAANIRIPSGVTDWCLSGHKDGGPRRMLINNFSASGGNTALVLEEPPHSPKVGDAQPMLHLFPFSAKTAKSLQEFMRRLLAWITQHPDVALADLAYTLAARRTHYSIREAFFAQSVPELYQQLEQATMKPSFTPSQRTVQTIFVFTGYSESQLSYYGELFSTSRLFRSEVTRLDQAIQRLGFVSILSLFQNDKEAQGTLSQNQLAHVTSQLAMAALLRSWSVSPSIVIGHSLGEYAALCASGVISPSDMLYLVGSRARLLEKSCTLRSHGMLAARCSVQDIRMHLKARQLEFEISCENGPEDTVLTGSVAVLHEIKNLLNESGFVSKLLDSPLAFHSSQMDPIMRDFVAATGKVKLGDPQIPFLCPLANKLVTEKTQLGANYLARQTRENVKFGRMLMTASDSKLVENQAVWVELGPRALCTQMVKSTLGPEIQIAPLLDSRRSGHSTESKAVELLYKAGVDINWTEFLGDQPNVPKLLDIPSYAFEEQVLWKKVQPASVQKTKVAPTNKSVGHRKLSSKLLHRVKSEMTQDGFMMLKFETDLNDPEIVGIFSGHVINGSRLCPGSVYVDLALAVADYLRIAEPKCFGSLNAVIQGLDITSPITLSKSNAKDTPKLCIIANCDLDDGQTRIRFVTTSAADDNSVVHAKCKIVFEQTKIRQPQWDKEQDTIMRETSYLQAGLLRGFSQRLFRPLVYRIFDDVIVYERKFQSMSEVLVDVERRCASAVLDLYQGSDSEGFSSCPFWTDGFFHVAGFVLNSFMAPPNSVYISSGWESYCVQKQVDLTKKYRVFVRVDDKLGSKVTASCFIFEDDTIIGEITSVTFQQVSRLALNKILPPEEPQVQLVDAAPESQQRPSTTVTPNLPPQPPPTVMSEPKAKPAVSPSHQLLDILAEEMGTSVESVQVDSQLADLGIDSLLSFSILSRLREEFDPNIPVTLLTPEITVSSLQTYVENLCSSGNDDASSTSESSDTYSATTATATDLMDIRNDTDSFSSSSSLNSILRKGISEQLCIDIDSFSDSQNLIELGMDSLMSMEIIDALQKSLGVTLDAATLMNNTSVKEIEAALSKYSPQNAIKKIASPPPTRPPMQSLSICLQGDSKTSDRTLFLFPDGSGSAAVYSRLPLIDDSLCVQGLNSPYLRTNTAFDILDLVQSWVAEIQRLKPQGPYHLGGWSSGGYYAYEATKLLQSQGAAVETLICIDTPSRTEYEAMPEDVLDALANSGVMGDQGQKAPQWLVDHFKHTVRTVAKYNPTSLKMSNPPKTYLIWAAIGLKVEDHVASTAGFKTRIAEFFQSDAVPNSYGGWDSLLPSSNLWTSITPGSHFSMIFPPNAQSLSNTIAAALAGQTDAFRFPAGKPPAESLAPVWTPEVATMELQRLKKYMSIQRPASEKSLLQSLRLVSLCAIRRALAEISEEESKRLPLYHRRFYEWMQLQYQLAEKDSISMTQSDSRVEVNAMEVATISGDVDSSLLMRVGQNLVPILRQAIPPLPLMMRDRLLHRYYESTIRVRHSFSQVSLLVRRVLAQTAQAPRVLEIGSGTGSCTEHVLRAITAHEQACRIVGPRTQYTYTDISPGFFKDAKARFSEHAARLDFRRFDVEKEPEKQGFEAGTYDLIVACQMLHVPTDTVGVLHRVRRLLRPGGKLIMVETTHDAVDISLIFGVLPGWWPADESRWLTPSLSVTQWETALQQAGFTNGMDIEARDSDTEEYSLSVFMATAP